MRYTEEQYELSSKVKETVCKYFGINPSDLINRCKAESISNARFYIWYILHTKYKMSFGVLSILYYRGDRNIRHGVSKIKYGIKEQPYYKKIYEEILLMLDK